MAVVAGLPVVAALGRLRQLEMPPEVKAALAWATYQVLRVAVA
jgi:hypothetical protein